MQGQQRQHLGDLGARAAPRRQAHRAEPDPLAGHRIHPAVIDPRCLHRHGPRSGQDLTLTGVAVAHHQPPATLVPRSGAGDQIVVDLGLQGGGKHPPGALAGQPIQVHPQFGSRGLISHYTQHAASPSSPALPRRSPTWVGQAGGSVALSSREPIHNFRSYLSARCGLVLLVMVGLVGRRDVEQARYDEALGHRPRSVRPG
jgi:hypothetical protein